jgi:hypothetical protein
MLAIVFRPARRVGLRLVGRPMKGRYTFRLSSGRVGDDHLVDSSDDHAAPGGGLDQFARPRPGAAASFLKEELLNVQVVVDWNGCSSIRSRVSSVNRLVIPAATDPLQPHIRERDERLLHPRPGSMIYTMNRMQTNLHLIADGPGQFMGLSAMFSGDTFASMHFNVDSVTPDQFKAWVDETRSSGGKTLDSDAYKELSKPSSNVAPFVFSDVEPDVFQKILTQVLPPGPGPKLGPIVDADPWLALCMGK